MTPLSAASTLTRTTLSTVCTAPRLTMNASRVLVLLALACVWSSAARATPLDDLRSAQVSKLEFGTFKLEVALNAIKNWPAPIEGAGVAYKIDPDKLDIVIAVRKVPAESFRTVCAATITRVREFLYVDANGSATMGRSYLSAYFATVGRGGAREIALRAIDASTQIRVNVVGLGSCHAALIKAPVTFDASTPAK